MRTTFHVAVNAKGKARLTKRLPDLYAGEVAVKVTLDIPNEAFRSPFVEANIDVPEGFVIRPDVDVWLEPIEDEAGGDG